MAINVPIFAGSASFFPGDTSFEFYDYDTQFQQDVEKVTVWVARRLGYPIMDVELSNYQLFDCFEQAVTEYSYLVNSFHARDNLLTVLGIPTGSVSFTGKYLDRSLTSVFKLAKEYGTVVGSGGTQTWYTGSISVNPDTQVYDLTQDAILEKGNPATDAFTVRRIFFEGPPSLAKYFDPYLGTGFGSQQLMDQFGWGSFSPPLNFLLMPVHYDVMRMQAIELNDQIRKSGYSFQLTRNRLRIFPIPQNEYKCFFHYTLDYENLPGGSADDNSTGRITGHSNIPYYNLEYRYINDLGRRWIRRFTLALAKETLGYVRSKYSDVPLGDQTVSLNGSDLVAQGQDEQQALIEELKETLDLLTDKSQLENKVSVAESLNASLKYVPNKIFIR